MEQLIPWKDLDTTPLATAQKMELSILDHVLQSSEDAYYNRGDSALSDESYDIIKQYVESQHPQLPPRVGAPVDSSCISDRKCKLPVYMGSLNKITELHASMLKTFVTKYKTDEYVVSDKLDGNSALLILHRNDAVGEQMFTRGNGFEGLDISHVVSTMLPDIGNKLWSKVMDPTLQTILIRGEVILTRKAFSDSLRHKGGATARNMIAGMLNSKVPDPEILAASDFIAYEVIEPVLRPTDQIDFLQRLGVQHAHSEVWSSDTLTFAQLQEHLRNRTRLSEYEIDGLVIVHNAAHAREVGQNPRHAFAFKDCEALHRENVTVRYVDWKISKDCRYVPTIHFDAVTIDNVNIQRATGFNAKFIADHGVGPGARAVVVRAGAVIPHITQVLAASPTGPQLPENAVWSQSGVDLVLRLDDTAGSSTHILAKKLLHHFFDKIGVMGLGPALVERLYDTGINKVDTIAQATVEDLCKVPGVKVTLARKLKTSIGTSISHLTVLKLMEACNAFGRGFGSKKLEVLIKAVQDGDRKRVTQDALCQIKGIDRLTACAFIDGMARFNEFCESNPFIWSRVQQNSKSMPSLTKDTKDTKFSYVFSGFRDRELEARFSGHDEIMFENTVSRSTSAVIVAAIDTKDTTKTRRARELGVPIIDLQHFLSRHGKKPAMVL